MCITIREDHSCGRYRSCKGAATGFVYAGDKAKALGVQLFLVKKIRHVSGMGFRPGSVHAINHLAETTGKSPLFRADQSRKVFQVGFIRLLG